ncbi:MAG TPA: protocatechuate 3,4-dioxygenase subunit alpha [Candidatus Acidoferrum sp.]|jgi:protocatechuate 3,4-dioxygenase alpha subunit|nr:protocatechuate 3,4-dioxygenase subunit alpha [Candidatus Acidoferrum sp.]
MSFQATSSQTVGPFFQIGLARFYIDDLTGPGICGETIEIVGRVFDGDGQPVPDGVIEIWQADAQGKYAHPELSAELENIQKNDIPAKEHMEGQRGEGAFRGFGRVPTQSDGSFRFKTIKPGRVPAPDGTVQAPHIAVSVFTRGLMRRLVTRIYFPDEPSNAADFALKLVKAGRRHTLIAKKVRGSQLEWNVVLQGKDETVFFDC